MVRIKAYLLLILMLFASISVSAQKKSDQDSLIRLLQAESARQYELYGMLVREVKGDQATFLHNNTYLLCDSAKWNVDSGIIEAYGHVQIVQDQTRLTSDNLTYLIDDNLAKFRGGIVELTDKKGNLLRTDQLDYNTKDSVAIFHYGAAMKDVDGNVMESVSGTYDSKINTFTFENRVELYTDSAFLKTDVMRYLTNEERAYFSDNTFAWRDKGFVKANGGWYDTKSHLLCFNNDVFMNDPDYEAWADEVLYYQDSSFVEMRDNVQILDTADKMIIFAKKAQYDRISGTATLPELPSILYFGENEEHEVDTLFMCADSMLFYSVKKNEIPQEDIEAASKRKEDMLYDSLTAQRVEQALKRQEEWVNEMKQYGKLPLDYDPDDPDGSKKRAADSVAAANAISDSTFSEKTLNSGHSDPNADEQQKIDSSEKLNATDIPIDTLATDNMLAPMDSLAPADTLVVIDTTLIKYVLAYHNVKMYRSDIQAKCDSVVFCELDSIARMFNRPVLWNAGKNQLTSTTMQLLMQDGNVTRGSMLGDAMITSQEDTSHYNQIKSTEMTGYFRDNELYRFDALGGVNAVFYLVEDNALTTLNMKESRSLTAVIKNGNAEKLLYTETIKSDAYPISDMEIEKQRLSGFEWRGDERPQSRYEITDRVAKPSERELYVNVTRPTYRYVNRYFDNCMLAITNKIYSPGRQLMLDIERQRKAEAELRNKNENNSDESVVSDNTSPIEIVEEFGSQYKQGLSLEETQVAGLSLNEVEENIAEHVEDILPDLLSDEKKDSIEIDLNGTLEQIESVRKAKENVEQLENQNKNKREIRAAEREVKKAERKLKRAERRLARQAVRLSRRLAKSTGNKH